MSLDVVDLRDFYGRPLGSAVRRLLTRSIRARWRNLQGAHLMASKDPRIVADIARRLRGEPPFATTPAEPLPRM